MARCTSGEPLPGLEGGREGGRKPHILNGNKVVRSKLSRDYISPDILLRSNVPWLRNLALNRRAAGLTRILDLVSACNSNVIKNDYPSLNDVSVCIG